MTEPIGTTVVVHLDPPYRHARHWLGWTRDVSGLVAAIMADGGPRVIRAAKRAGCSPMVARMIDNTTPGYKDRLKAAKNTPRLCPVCTAGPRKEEHEHALQRISGSRG